MRARSKPWVVVIFAAVALGASAHRGRALAQADEDPLKSKFVIDDAAPERSVPDAKEAMKQPLEMGYQLMQLTEKAEAAAKRGDHRGAAHYWAAIAKAVPDRSLPFARMCQEYDAVPDYAAAVENCRAALARGGVTLEDSLRFVRIVIEKPTKALDPQEIEDVQAVSDHLEKELGQSEGPLVANRIRCQLATRLDDVKQLEVCSKKLERLAPNDTQTLVFAWSLSIRQGELDRAQQLVERAKHAGIPAAAIDKMAATLQLEVARQAPWWRRALREGHTRGVVIALAVLFVAMALVLGRRRQRVGAA